MGECISFYSSEKIGEVKHCQQFLIPSGRTYYLQVFNEKLKSQGYKMYIHRHIYNGSIQCGIQTYRYFRYELLLGKNPRRIKWLYLQVGIQYTRYVFCQTYIHRFIFPYIRLICLKINIIDINNKKIIKIRCIYFCFY